MMKRKIWIGLIIIAAVALAAELVILVSLERGGVDAFKDKESTADTQSGQTQSVTDSTPGDFGDAVGLPTETDRQLPGTTESTEGTTGSTQGPTEKVPEGTTDGIDDPRDHNFGDVDWD